jgi:prepilin-type processing-associated H-X9-DG protein
MIRESQVLAPADLVALADYGRITDPDGDDSFSPDDLFSELTGKHHAGSAAVVFCDAHVESASTIVGPLIPLRPGSAGTMTIYHTLMHVPSVATQGPQTLCLSSLLIDSIIRLGQIGSLISSVLGPSLARDGPFYFCAGGLRPSGTLIAPFAGQPARPCSKS